MPDLTPEERAEWRENAERHNAEKWKRGWTYNLFEVDPDTSNDRVLSLLDALDEEQRTRVEITRTLVNPDNCKVWRDGVLVFDGVSLDTLAAEKAARQEAEREVRIADRATAQEIQARIKAEQERDDALALLYEIQEMETDNG